MNDLTLCLIKLFKFGNFTELATVFHHLVFSNGQLIHIRIVLIVTTTLVSIQTLSPILCFLLLMDTHHWLLCSESPIFSFVCVVYFTIFSKLVLNFWPRYLIYWRLNIRYTLEIIFFSTIFIYFDISFLKFWKFIINNSLLSSHPISRFDFSNKSRKHLNLILLIRLIENPPWIDSRITFVFSKGQLVECGRTTHDVDICFIWFIHYLSRFSFIVLLNHRLESYHYFTFYNLGIVII